MARGQIKTIKGKRGISYKVIVELGADGDDKRRRKTENYHNKREAEKRLTELLRQADTGMLTDTKKMTVGKYFEYWLENYCKPNLAASTYYGYDLIVKKHIGPILGALFLDKLQPAHIQNYYSQALKGGRKGGKGERGEGLSPTTVLYHHRVLREALKHAVRWQILARNPADACTPPRKDRPEMQIFSEEQITRLLDHLRGSYLYMPTYLAIASGMRAGEILGLSWSDVDLEAGAITVRRALQRFKKGETPTFGKPKTSGSMRRVDLFPDAIAELKGQRKELAAQRLMAGGCWQDYDLVCCHADGSPISPASFARTFKDKTGELKMTGRFHDLRHSHATFLLKHGVHPKVVAERLGHSNIGITMDTYSHVLPTMGKQAAEIIGQHLFGKPAEETDGTKSAPKRKSSGFPEAL